MTLAETLPSWNAAMNATSACALFAGWVAIRRRNYALHWKLMATAFAASVLFLAGYLTRFALTGVHRFPLGGPVRTFYYLLLGTHTVLAAVALPFVLRTIWLSAVKRSSPQIACRGARGHVRHHPWRTGSSRRASAARLV